MSLTDDCIENLRKISPPKNRKPVPFTSTSTVSFAFADEKGNILHPLQDCKDYLHEVVRDFFSSKNRCHINLYGKLNTKALTLLCTTYIEGNTIKNSINLIHEIEDIFGLERTKIVYMGNAVINKSENLYNNGAYKTKELWFIEASRDWAIAAPILSFFLLLIRVGVLYDGSGIDTFFNGNKGNETKYKTLHQGGLERDYYNLVNSLPFWKKIMELSPKEVFGLSMAKNYSGSCGPSHIEGFSWMSKETYNSKYPHWVTFK